MYIWFFLYIFLSIFVLYQRYKGIDMTWREFGFFIAGVLFGGIPYFWVVYHSL